MATAARSKTAAAAAGAAAAETKPAAAGAGAETAVYEVISPLDFDNEPYAIGAEVELTAAQAAQLLGHTVKTPGAE